jgi:hypothetical protein
MASSQSKMHGCIELLILIMCRRTSSLKDNFQVDNPGGLLLKMSLFLSVQMHQAAIIKTSVKKGWGKACLAK